MEEEASKMKKMRSMVMKRMKRKFFHPMSLEVAIIIGEEVTMKERIY
jgi:hypothetical protein